MKSAEEWLKEAMAVEYGCVSLSSGFSKLIRRVQADVVEAALGMVETKAHGIPRPPFTDWGFGYTEACRNISDGILALKPEAK